MKFFYDNRQSLSSSVLSTAYYSEPERRLVLALRNGGLCGYESVPFEIYLSLSQAPSPGAYWNTFIKDRFPGFSTSDIDEFVEYHQLIWATDADAEPEPDVSFTATFGTFEFGLLARDWNDALDKVNRTRDLLGFTDDLIKLTRDPG
jgi:hypothetical protein